MNFARGFPSYPPLVTLFALMFTHPPLDSDGSSPLSVAGKAILVGEHFAVYGASALAVALPDAVRVRSVDASRLELSVPQWNATFPADASGAPLSQAFAQLLEALPASKPMRLELSIAVPTGVGLGSSASIGVAVLRALGRANGWSYSDEEQYALLFHWERVFHGTPSGLDHAAALREGLTRFRRFEEPPLVALPLSHPLHLVLAHVSEGASTKAMVEHVRVWREAHRAIFDALLASAEDRAERLVRALDGGAHAEAGVVLDENQQDLQRIGVSSPALDAACARARAAGAFGAKLVGAGGGGCVVALTDAARFLPVRAALDDVSLVTIPLHLPVSH